MSSFTCLMCPNGCGLSIVDKNKTLFVRGNRCIRGVKYAEKRCQKQGITGRFISERSFLHYGTEEIETILKKWGVTLEKRNEEQFIPGSPERSLYRDMVICDGETLILEQIEASSAVKHEKMATRLDRMVKKGLPVTPFKRGHNVFVIQAYNDKFWQLTPFRKGIPLNRNTYWRESWRGQALAEFLCSLYESEKPEEKAPVFDLISFIKELKLKIDKTYPQLSTRIDPIIANLEENLFSLYHEMPVVFAHGDPHPLNVIWGEEKIITMIDWEFSGSKPLLYDASLIMGCVGSEDPEALDSPFNRAFYGVLKESPLFPAHWLRLLPSFILAQRFAWLNEWLRHDDEIMQQQELTYMEMLL